MIQIKRVYEDYATADGYRILVDRLWPRGISREKGRIDEWIKEIAPSNELRKWFNHDPEKYPAFVKKYKAELADKDDILEALRKKAKKEKITLLYGSRDLVHNQAKVLMDMLRS
ncbi:DUF488 domain-containing protein [Chitinophaga solisilvae]|uniref:DUF488 domain-containing protein n=1 Tax=Chitinophaga solisilvae TaxID=1233460 RepID=UPI001368B70A|nr:DUF488 domain-containing protein [Chitinophaga solisilvae]